MIAIGKQIKINGPLHFRRSLRTATTTERIMRIENILNKETACLSARRQAHTAGLYKCQIAMIDRNRNARQCEAALEDRRILSF